MCGVINNFLNVNELGNGLLFDYQNTKYQKLSYKTRGSRFSKFSHSFCFLHDILILQIFRNIILIHTIVQQFQKNDYIITEIKNTYWDLSI